MPLDARVTGEPPRVAIVTPSYRMARFIGETVDSVLAQDYPHVDYLVVDGGSADGTVELLEERGVRYVSEPDGGQAYAVNKGFALTEGELFTFLNADDTLLPGALARRSRRCEATQPRRSYTGRRTTSTRRAAP